METEGAEDNKKGEKYVTGPVEDMKNFLPFSSASTAELGKKKSVEERNIVLSEAISGSKLGTFPLKNVTVQHLEKFET